MDISSEHEEERFLGSQKVLTMEGNFREAVGLLLGWLEMSD
jgi:hypothetical protein